jgi:antirestriction protein
MNTVINLIAERNKNMSTPKIYVASLADYNNGTLYGKWIDADQSGDAIQDEVNAMLKASSIPNCEEWAIHAHEGFDDIVINEYDSFEKVSKLAELLAAHGKAYSAWYNNDGNREDLEDLEEKFNECFIGEYESLADYAEQFTAESGQEIPEYLANYIDYEAMGKDWEYGGDIFTVKNGYKSLFIFRNN